MITARTTSGRVSPVSILLAAAVMIGLAAQGCSLGQAMMSRRAHTAREKLVGMSRDDVLHCAGEPAGVQRRGSWEYLSYLSGKPVSGSTRCVTTFTLQRGYVESVDYENANGNLIGKSISECLDTVGPCLAALE